MRALVRWLRDGAVPMLLARLVLAAVFIVLAIHKVEEPVPFLKALRDYDMFPLTPPHLMNLTVVALPWIEILAGALLVVGFWLRPVGLLLAALTVAFTAAIVLRGFGLAATEGKSLCDVAFDCGCGQGVVFFCSKFAENIGLIALALLIALSRSRFLALDGLLRRGART
jgi:uncharacterized membrane protein YphA (DoxX/SURF4 family)